MKVISTKGLYNMQVFQRLCGVGVVVSYVSGDLYEAEELYQDGHPIKQNRLLFLHYPRRAHRSLSSPTRAVFWRSRL